MPFLALSPDDEVLTFNDALEPQPDDSLLATFDVVVLYGVMEKTHDWRVPMREAARWLKPGGRVYVHSSSLSPLRQPENRRMVTAATVARWLVRTEYDLLMAHTRGERTYALGKLR